MHMIKIAAISAAALLIAGCGDHKGAGNNMVGNNSSGNPAPKGKPHGPGKDQDIRLSYNQAFDTWKVKLDPNGPEKDPKEAITTLDEDVGPTKFTVTIAGNATFKDGAELDVWEGMNQKGNPKPGINSTQIIGPIVSSNKKSLIFYDLNYGASVRLNYQFNFNGTVSSVDPIIDNGGGTWN